MKIETIYADLPIDVQAQLKRLIAKYVLHFPPEYPASEVHSNAIMCATMIVDYLRAGELDLEDLEAANEKASVLEAQWFLACRVGDRRCFASDENQEWWQTGEQPPWEQHDDA